MYISQIFLKIEINTIYSRDTKMKGRLSSLPKYVYISPVDYADLNSNLKELNDLLPLVFRIPLGCWLISHFPYEAELFISAINPANKEVWFQRFLICKNGTVCAPGAQRLAAWVWKWSYFNKIIRIIRFWLSENTLEKHSMRRIQERASRLSLELIRNAGRVCV